MRRPHPSAPRLGIAAGILLVTALGVGGASPARGASRVACIGDAPLALPAALAPVRARIDSLVTHGHLPSVVVIVDSAGHSLWTEALGWADREGGRCATTDTPFRVASVTKAFTATAALRLVEEGRLSLDAPVASLLGHPLLALAGDARGVTPRRLLDMTAGIPHYWQFVPPDSAARALDPAAQVARYGIVAFPPGRSFTYSNLSYGALGEVIAHSSGTTYADYVRRALFAPLGMTHATIVERGGPPAGTATGYDRAGHPLPPFGFAPPGGAGAVASAADLLRFARFHLGATEAGAPVGAATLAELHRAPRLGEANRSDEHVGYHDGWGIIDAGTRDEAWLSNGALEGTAVSVLLLPAHQLAIVVLSNASNGPADDLVFDIAGRMVPPFARSLAVAMREGEALQRPRPLGDAKVAGRWRGTLVLPAAGGGWDSLAVTLEVTAKGTARMGIAGDSVRTLANARLENGLVMGRIESRVAVAGGIGESSGIELELRPGGRTLTGVARVVRDGPVGTAFGIPAGLVLRRDGPAAAAH